MMKRAEFETLDDSSLVRACLEPVIGQIKGKDLNIKSKAYSQLNAGQRALLMFWVLYGHSQNGVRQFYGEVGYLLDQPGVFGEFIRAAEYFQDASMRDLVTGMEEFYAAASQGAKCDTEEELDRLDEKCRLVSPSSLKLASNYVRQNADLFLEIEG
jgi:hypothetical protein